jgi:hypothetical protein
MSIYYRVHRPLCTIQILQVSLPSYPRVCSLSSLCFFYRGCIMLRFVTTLLMLSTFASGQSCGKAEKCCTGQTCKANGFVCIVPSADHVENGCTACVVRATHAHKKSTVFLRLVKLGRHVFQTTRLSSNHERWTNHTVELLSTWTNHRDIVVPDTTDLFFNYFPAPPSFNPQKMLENINLAEELSRPVIPSDVHSGSLDPDPLPQDSKGTPFSDHQNLQKHSL